MTRARLIGVTLLLVLLAPRGVQVNATGNSAEVVFAWNQVLQNTIPGAGGPAAPRFYALTHIAMFDAVNSIERQYAAYHVRLAQRGGSPEAAAAQAAHDVLVALNPPSAAAYDALLAQQIGTRPSWFVRRGQQTGAAVAAKILAWRQNDGWIVPAPPAYAEPALPGRWQPTPPNNPAPAFTQLLYATPLAMASATHFLPPPPPPLTSERYAADLQEVQLLGAADSATRTPEQTATARLWASVAMPGAGTPTWAFAVWNNVAADVARERHFSLLDAARLFALMNVSIHDGLHTTMASKYVYNLWRPVTAIRMADTDLNPATVADPGWLPLLTTPPYPSYAGNMAVIGASAARALQLTFGTDRIPVVATWRQAGAPDVQHAFDGFWAMAEEQSMSRIWGGIHYRFDQGPAQTIGKSVAEFVAANYMRKAR